MSLKLIRNILLVAGFTTVVFGTGYKLGLSQSPVPYLKPTFSNTDVPATKNVDFALFWDVWSRLEDSFIDKKALDPEKMFYGAISGMVSSLEDPYTAFLPPKENKDAKDSLAGHFDGIGAQLGIKDKKIIVVAPLSGTPAEAAGLKSGDWIVKVNGKETVNWNLPQAVSNIRGERGTKVTLNILSEGETEPRDVEIIRDNINVPSVVWEVKTASGSAKKSIHLKLSQFGGQTNDEWLKGVSEINSYLATDSAKTVKGIVLDMRNNPGGYLSGAVFIASEFLPDGAVVLQEDKTGRRQTFSVNREGKLTNIPLVVLINRGSASASEIVAGAIQDRKRGRVVGEVSFGKGSIQDVQELQGGAGLHVTVAKWLTPSGKWINRDGVTPDVKVEPDEENPENDVQFNKAIEIL
ncbi:S41 family peptidase [Candidatus Gottesmanbacteria bacterium]|nr:S41 family peptidase [Candidatus Gottesmanbacteria bacterium]